MSKQALAVGCYEQFNNMATACIMAYDSSMADLNNTSTGAAALLSSTTLYDQLSLTGTYLIQKASINNSFNDCLDHADLVWCNCMGC